jgi:FMN-dependent NADH-azoreductase
MKKLLHLDSSLRSENSISRMLSAQFAQAWNAKYPDGEIIYRDFAIHPLPHLTSNYVTASYKNLAERDAQDIASSELANATVAELFAVDHILIGAPMYNFTVPSTIKTWVDHIVKEGSTFRFGEQGPEALVHGKKVCVVTSHGGDYSADSPWAPMDMLGPWLKNILGFLGMTDLAVISAQNMDLAVDKKADQLAKANAEIQATLAQW